jgi:hypothetical protein
MLARDRGSAGGAPLLEVGDVVVEGADADAEDPCDRLGRLLGVGQESTGRREQLGVDHAGGRRCGPGPWRRGGRRACLPRRARARTRRERRRCGRPICHRPWWCRSTPSGKVKPTPLSFSSAMRSWRERPRRSSRVTMSRSPTWPKSKASGRPGRSAFLPESLSVKIRRHPRRRSSSIWESSRWSRVDARIRRRCRRPGREDEFFGCRGLDHPEHPARCSTKGRSEVLEPQRHPEVFERVFDRRGRLDRGLPPPRERGSGNDRFLTRSASVPGQSASR